MEREEERRGEERQGKRREEERGGGEMKLKLSLAPTRTARSTPARERGGNARTHREERE